MFESIYEAFWKRREALCGRIASPEEVDALDRRLTGRHAEGIIRAYRDLPICDLLMDFLVDPLTGPRAPEPQFRAQYDPDREYSMICLWPHHVLMELDESASVYAGALVRAGFLPVGSCAMGGDGYFLLLDNVPRKSTPLYRVYYDWIDTDSHIIPPEGIHLLTDCFEQVIRVAKLQRS